MFTPNLGPLKDADEAEDVVAHLWGSDLTPDATQADGTGLSPRWPTATVRVSCFTPVIPCANTHTHNSSAIDNETKTAAIYSYHHSVFQQNTNIRAV